jgi:hypothetical protein
MKRTSLLLAVHAVASFAALAQSQVATPGLPRPQPQPCAAAEHRQFDFWLGEWQVHGPAGQLAGINTITREFNGCVLVERYDTGRGYSGSSFNIYDAGRGKWHQTWVDSGGLLLRLEGGFAAGKMQLAGETVGTDGVSTRHRITWTPQPDGSVRQSWETSKGAAAWEVAFDGRYTRKTAATR